MDGEAEYPSSGTQGADSEWIVSWLVNRSPAARSAIMRVVRLRFAAHPVGYVFADHDGGEVDVRARDGGHDRRVGRAQAGDGADPAVLVDDGHRVAGRAHAGG